MRSGVRLGHGQGLISPHLFHQVECNGYMVFGVYAVRSFSHITSQDIQATNTSLKSGSEIKSFVTLQ